MISHTTILLNGALCSRLRALRKFRRCGVIATLVGASWVRRANEIRYRRAITSLQKCGRGFVARVGRRRALLAARLIQRFTRGHMARNKSDELISRFRANKRRCGSSGASAGSARVAAAAKALGGSPTKKGAVGAGEEHDNFGLDDSDSDDEANEMFKVHTQRLTIGKLLTNCCLLAGAAQSPLQRQPARHARPPAWQAQSRRRGGLGVGGRPRSEEAVVVRA